MQPKRPNNYAMNCTRSTLPKLLPTTEAMLPKQYRPKPSAREVIAAEEANAELLGSTA